MKTGFWRFWGMFCGVATVALIGLVAAGGARGLEPPQETNGDPSAPVATTTTTSPASTAPVTTTTTTTTGTTTTDDPAIGGAAALAKGRWQRRARSPLGNPDDAVVAWTGTKLLEIGGGPFLGRIYKTGAAFTPATGRWSRIADAPADVYPENADTVWTGAELFVLGDSSEGTDRVAGLYDPTTNRWHITSPLPIRNVLTLGGTAVWNGREVILTAQVAASTPGFFRPVELSYDPATDAWSILTPPPVTNHPAREATMVDTTDGVLLWVLWNRGGASGLSSGDTASRSSCRSDCEATRTKSVSGVDVYRMTGSGFRRLRVTWPAHDEPTDPIFTGSTVLLAPSIEVWCGQNCFQRNPHPVGQEVNPRTLKITAQPHGEQDREGPLLAWTGLAEVAWSPDTGFSPDFFDPSARRWYAGHAPGVAVLNDEPAFIWDGSALLTIGDHGYLYSDSAPRQ